MGDNELEYPEKKERKYQTISLYEETVKKLKLFYDYSDDCYSTVIERLINKTIEIRNLKNKIKKIEKKTNKIAYASELLEEDIHELESFKEILLHLEKEYENKLNRIKQT